MSVDRARATAIFEEIGAVRTGGHFVYTSGLHGSAYVNKDAIYPDTNRISELCAMLADLLRPYRPEVVCGPAVAGIIVSQWTGHHLGVPAVYADKDEPRGLVLRRGYDRLVEGRRVAVVEDVLTTGGSLAATVEVVRGCGGDVVAAAALVNRGGVTATDVGVPVLESLVSFDFAAVGASECELCAQGVPVDTSVGKGATVRR